jgi:Protein of unknown function (DUF2905)
MAELGKWLIVCGVVLVVVGGVLVLSGALAGRVPFLGRLPGDIHVERGSWSFYFPITTSIVISVILTLILNLFFRR